MVTLLLEDPSIIQQMDWAPECVVLSQWCQHGLLIFFPSWTRSLFSEHQKNYVACIEEAMSCKNHIKLCLSMSCWICVAMCEDCISSGQKGPLRERHLNREALWGGEVCACPCLPPTGLEQVTQRHHRFVPHVNEDHTSLQGCNRIEKNF